MNSIKEFIEFLYNEKNRGEDDSFLKSLSEILLFNCTDYNDRKQIYELYIQSNKLSNDKKYYCTNEKDSQQFKEKEIVRTYKFMRDVPYGEYEKYWLLFCSGNSHKKIEILEFERKIEFTPLNQKILFYEKKVI